MSPVGVLATGRHWPVFLQHDAPELASYMFLCSFLYTNMLNKMCTFPAMSFFSYIVQSVYLYTIYVCRYINTQTHSHTNQHTCLELPSSP